MATLVNMPKRDAERYLALEFVVACAVRTIYAFREQGTLLGPSSYGVIVITYAILAVFVMFDQTADVAAIIGLIVLVAMLLRHTSPTGAGSSTVGRDVGMTLAGFSQRVGDAPPTTAEGVKAAQPPSGGGSGGSGGGDGGSGPFNPLDPYGIIGGTLGKLIPVGRTTDALQNAMTNAANPYQGIV